METEMKKVHFQLDELTESVWAKKDGEYFLVCNSPFFAKGVSFEDVISVEDRDGLLWFRDVVKHSGNSTLRVFFLKDNLLSADVQGILKELSKLGATYEGNGEHLVSLNVPKEVLLQPIYDFLQNLEENEILEYEDAYIAK